MHALVPPSAPSLIADQIPTLQGTQANHRPTVKAHSSATRLSQAQSMRTKACAASADVEGRGDAEA